MYNMAYNLIKHLLFIWNVFDVIKHSAEEKNSSAQLSVVASGFHTPPGDTLAGGSLASRCTSQHTPKDTGVKGRLPGQKEILWVSLFPSAIVKFQTVASDLKERRLSPRDPVFAGETRAGPTNRLCVSSRCWGRAKRMTAPSPRRKHEMAGQSRCWPVLSDGSMGVDSPESSLLGSSGRCCLGSACHKPLRLAPVW